MWIIFFRRMQANVNRRKKFDVASDGNNLYALTGELQIRTQQTRQRDLLFSPQSLMYRRAQLLIVLFVFVVVIIVVILSACRDSPALTLARRTRRIFCSMAPVISASSTTPAGTSTNTRGDTSS